MEAIQVACAVILKNGKMLIVQRSESMVLPLKWEFPGGKVEKGESEDDCIAREIEEELKIGIEVIERLDSFNIILADQEYTFVPFIAKHVSGEIELVEHKDYRLIELSEIFKYDFAEADVFVLENNINKINKLLQSV